MDEDSSDRSEMFGDNWRDGLDPWQVELADSLDDMVQELGRIPTTDAAYTDLSPYLSTGSCCCNCIAYGENGCDWVAVNPSENGWCKFVVVPILTKAAAETDAMYRELEKMDGPTVTAVHIDGSSNGGGVGSFTGGTKRKKYTPPNMTDLSPESDVVNPRVMQDANLMQKSEAIPNQIQKNAEMRYTLGPWYVPNRADAHGEWTDPEELQKALWGYVENGDRDIRLQHNVDVVAGKWVEAMTWPHEVEVPMLNAETGAINKTSFPAGTVFLGVQWEPWAWELVKKGKIRGYSIGGTGAGVNVDLPTQYDNPSTFPTITQ